MNGPVSDPHAGARSGGRIALYYVVLVVLAGVVLWRFPDAARMVTLGDEGNPVLNGEITRTLAGDVPLALPATAGWEGVWVTGLSLMGALLVMIPVAWTYILIKRRSGYEEAVVHALLILPVVVTGVVMIVGRNLALAFSLAGIVAAVRFRTTLDDTKDAVFVFLAIGVGLAAGVQALGVAAAMSFVFATLNLVLWRLNFGNVYVDQIRRTGGVSPGSAVAGSDPGALVFGDSKLMAALSPTDLKEVAERQARMASYLHQESDERRERKRYYVLMVYTASVSAAQAAVEPVLARFTIRWQLAEILPGSDGGSILEYLVRPSDDAPEGVFLDAIRRAGGESVQAAELRSLKRLASRDG